MKWITQLRGVCSFDSGSFVATDSNGSTIRFQSQGHLSLGPEEGTLGRRGGRQ